MASILLILSAMFHAGWNTLIKRSHDTNSAVMGVILVSALGNLVCALIFEGVGSFSTLGIQWNILAGIFEGVYMIALAHTLAKAPLGRSYIVMRGGAMLLVWLVSTVLLKEAVTVTILLGATSIFLGIIVANFEAKMFSRFEGLNWACLCAAGIAAYHLCYGQALHQGALPMTSGTIAMCISVPMFIFWGKNQRRFSFSAAPRTAIVGGLLCTLSFLIFLVGLKDSNAGHAITLRNTSIAFAQIFAVAIGEKIRLKQWLGTLLIILGAYLIA